MVGVSFFVTMIKGGRYIFQPGFQYTKGKPVLSVITVVYNSQQFIERTIKSVLSQTYSNIEYIIVDGGSKDDTLSIVKKYEDKMAMWVSEKDKGIYDAMNKGQNLAKGDYVLFLNSGDVFANETIIEQVFSNFESADIYYGDTGIISLDGEDIGMRRLSTPKKLSWKSLQYGMVVCHQSIMVKRDLTVPYDETYRISADIDWVINALKNARTIVNTHLMISKFMVGGASRVHMRRGLAERYKILAKHYGAITNMFNHAYITLRFIKHLLFRKNFV
jgi:glycosyltransferase involved in cell wall biosynthesis